jgi:hypothetical protein
MVVETAGDGAAGSVPGAQDVEQIPTTNNGERNTVPTYEARIVSSCLRSSYTFVQG